MIDFFSFNDGMMIEVGYESKAHSMVGVARAFPCFFHATSSQSSMDVDALIKLGQASDPILKPTR